MVETTSGGASPQTPATTSAAPAAGSLDISKQVSEARTPAELRALVAQVTPNMREALKPKPTKPDLPPDLAAAVAAEETPAAPEAEAAAETTEETPAAEETPAEETPAEVENDGEETDTGEADGPVTASKAKKLRLRLPESDEVGRLAAAYLQRNRDMSMTDAIAAAQKKLGIAPKPAEATPQVEAKPKSDLPETVEAVDAELDRLDSDREKALTELRFEDVAKIDRTLRKLDRHRTALERDAERKTVEAAETYNRQFDTSIARASELYAFASDPNSPGGKRMLEIERELQANDDPLYHSPLKPLKLAQMVAAELNIAPRKKGAPAATAKPAAPAAPAPKKQMLPSGGSRTTPVAANQKPAIDTKIQAVRNIADLRNLRREMGLPI
jgi:hypothetical protein